MICDTCRQPLPVGIMKRRPPVYTIQDMRQHGVGWVSEQQFTELLDLIEQLADGCYAGLNITGAAAAAVQFLPAHAGLEVPYHAEKMRAPLQHPLLANLR